MNNGQIRPEQYQSTEIASFCPPNEALLDVLAAHATWPEVVANNPELIQQIEARRGVYDRLAAVVDSLPQPTTTIEAAIEAGYISEQQARNLYLSLTTVLEDADYRRLALYLPFELIPDKSWQPVDKSLQAATERFKEAYMQAWDSLLTVHDVRANFMDGDVVELDQLVDDPRVVKAAHLIPILVEKGLITIQDAISLMDGNNDQILKHSVADALMVLGDLGYINQQEILAMETSGNWLVRNMARIIASSKKEQQIFQNDTAKINFTNVQESLNQALFSIESADFSQISQGRKTWLVKEQQRAAVTMQAKNVCQAIICAQLTNEDLEQFLSPQATTLSQRALAEGIREAIEAVSYDDFNKAQQLFNTYERVFLSLKDSNDPIVKEVVLIGYRYFYRLGIVNNQQLQALGINLPKLEGSFAENLPLLEDTLSEVGEITKHIEADYELSNLVYPIALVYGSRVKGYGKPDSDVDIAFFIKPGTPITKQDRLDQLLENTFNNTLNKPNESFEFWLEEAGDWLKIRDFENSDSTQLAPSYWTHFLFGAVWQGKPEIVQELRQKILLPFLFETSEQLRGLNARRLYLEQMEIGNLQYRLMHYGYRRHYPPYGGIDTPHANEIDGKSTFWDSGYRQLAAKLFISKVFLPKISK